MASQELLFYEMAAIKMRRWEEDGLSPLEGVAELVRELDNTNGWYRVCKTDLHYEQERRAQAGAERDRLAAALERAAFVAEHLMQMIDRETWRASGGDDGQGHYEGDYREEQLAEEIKGWQALAQTPQEQT